MTKQPKGASRRQRSPRSRVTEGSRTERKVADELKRQGFVVFRVSAPYRATVCDLVAVSPERVQFVEAKSDVEPWENFRPAQRLALRIAADHAGAEAWLAHWPVGGELAWIPSDQWP